MSKIEVNQISSQCGSTLTIGQSGDTVTLASGATQSGFGPTGAVSWNTTKITADPSPAVTGVGYFCDTSSAAFTVTLPATPAAGAVIAIADYANTFATNNVTVDRNGSDIGGIADNATLSTDGVSLTFVYVDATQGWIVTDSGQRSELTVPTYITATGGTITTVDTDYKVHTFTGPGTFTVCSVGNPIGSTTVDYLVVAGGAGNGVGSGGGAGGAGGVRTSSGVASGCYSSGPLGACVSALPVSATSYPIIVGSGGAGAPTSSAKGTPGVNSTFSTITSTGGGGGGSESAPVKPGAAGGSGGGGQGSPGTGGAGNTPPVSPPQGNAGGDGTISFYGGGGGGATASGANSAPAAGGAGGNGLQNSISSSAVYYGGGGGGGGQPGAGGAGGSGGGGAGGQANVIIGTAGTANTGGGAGGGVSSPPLSPNYGTANGGSGIVIVRYKFQ